MECYEGYRRAFETKEEVRSIRSQLRSLLGESDLAQIHDAVSTADGKLAQLEGEGEPERPEIMYGAIYAAAAGEETLAGLQQKFLHLMDMLQGADAKPTTQATEALRRLLAEGEAMDRRWGDWKESEIQTLNRRLADLGRPPLTFERK